MIRHSLGVIVAATYLVTSGFAQASEVPVCTVRIGLSESPATVRTLQFKIDYSRVQGSFAGSGDTLACRSDLADTGITTHDECVGAYAACQWGDGRFLSVAILGGAAGVSGPVELVRCDFESASTPSALDFDVAVTDATSTDFAPVDPPPLIDVLSVDCPQ